MILNLQSICLCDFFFQAEDGIRDLVRSRGLGDVYKRQKYNLAPNIKWQNFKIAPAPENVPTEGVLLGHNIFCLLYTSDAADERSSVDLGGRRIIKKKKQTTNR